MKNHGSGYFLHIFEILFRISLALFVSLNKPHSRLTESDVELQLREMGKKLGVEKVHPHKFRRTMATRAIEKGRMTSGGHQICADRSEAETAD